MYYIYTYNCLFLLTLDKKRSKYFKPTKYANTGPGLLQVLLYIL